jgi:hypothetical protein
LAASGQLGLVVAATLGLAWLGRPRAVLAAVLLVGFESLALPIPTTRIESPPAYRVLRDAARTDSKRGALLEIPPVHAQDKVYQLFQTTHGVPLCGGRLARTPLHAFDALHRDPFLSRLFESTPLQQQDGLLSLAGLDSLGVRWVMLHDRFDPRTATIERILSRQYERIPTPPGPERLLRRRD